MKPDRNVDRREAWAAHDLDQLRYFRSLSLRAKLEAVQGMADVVRRFRELRDEGRFVSRAPQARQRPAQSHGRIDVRADEPIR